MPTSTNTWSDMYIYTSDFTTVTIDQPYVKYTYCWEPEKEFEAIDIDQLISDCAEEQDGVLTDGICDR